MVLTKIHSIVRPLKFFEVLLMFGAKWNLLIFICEITDVKDIEKRPLRDSSISAVDKLH